MKFKDLIQLILTLILLGLLGTATLVISHWDNYPEKDPFSNAQKGE